MTAVQRSADWIDLVESAYSTRSDEVGWLERVAASAGAISARRVVACSYDATKPDWVGIDGVAAHGVGADVVRRMFTLSIPREPARDDSGWHVVEGGRGALPAVGSR
jgi:hypothetical protein